ncbi:hypothetical protein [Methanobrevibacter arboriphilus]|nr:hypothetical protein [Methanobrevibacter arboriphilus]
MKYIKLILIIGNIDMIIKKQKLVAYDYDAMNPKKGKYHDIFL